MKAWTSDSNGAAKFQQAANAVLRALSERRENEKLFRACMKLSIAIKLNPRLYSAKPAPPKKRIKPISAPTRKLVSGVTEHPKKRGPKPKVMPLKGKKREDLYSSLLAKQKGMCAICGGFEQRGRRLKRIKGSRSRLSVDHCHRTNGIRGLLCGNCNSGLGFFRDSIKNLKAAIKYLRRAPIWP